MDRKIAGFSILEILIVIAILSILMAISVSVYTKYKLDRELTKQANQLLDEISWVKSQSISKEPHGITITKTYYTIFKDSDGDCDYTPGNEIIRQVNFIHGITCSTCSRLNQTLNQTFVFDRKGYPRGSNCALGTVEGTITLENANNNSKNIKISRYGRTRIE